MTVGEEQRTVLLGVTGSIAAYKACELVRLLQKAGLRVKVVMTKTATQLVAPATFKALTREPVAVALIDEPNAPVHHISLAREADVFCIAPCTANVINKIANGVADDLLTTTAMATTAPLLIAPAMNMEMWRSAVTQESLKRLRQRGVGVVAPEDGYLACGEEGAGRLAEPAQICEAVLGELGLSRSLAQKRLLVTAGPTREHLDPVRFISSPSSGLMGFCIAQEAVRRGASVQLVTGPVALPDPSGVSVVRVVSALEMLEACREPFAEADAAVFSAAVSDFRPASRAEQKVKKGTAALDVQLLANPDILATLAADKGSTYVVGFAAETEDVLDNARLKLAAKNADMIVANDVSTPGLGFGSDNNKAWLLTGQSAADVQETDVVSKRELANMIVDRIAAAITKVPCSA